MTYLERLRDRLEAVGSSLCLGIDPDPEALPSGYPRDVAGIERFAELLLDVGLPHAAAVKANVAFFEAYGSTGFAALERLRTRIPAEVPFIADAKRADIPTTAARQAVALFDALGADAITASPYVGRDALEPFLARTDRFVYVLCRTSNPGAAAIQELTADGEPLYLRVARLATSWAGEHSNLGLVVGATAPSELALVRRRAPGLAVLVPGIGAQGGDLAAVRESGPAVAGDAAAARGGSLLVNVSRGIAATAAGADDPKAAVTAAAARWAAELRC